jgi:GT2 family glycosyltransferase
MSTDDSVTYVKSLMKKNSNISLVINATNQGPSESRNIGIKNVSTEFVYFLDNDTEVDPNFLLECEKTFSNDSSVGAVQSMLCDFDERKKIQNAGLTLIPYAAWAIGLSAGETYSPKKEYKKEVLGLSAALAVKLEVFKNGINFDRLFYHYSEDLDFSWRMWVAGYKTLLSKNSVVYHKVKKIGERKNVGADNSVVYFHLVKNSIRSMIKNYQLLSLLLYLPTCLLIVLLRAILVLIVRADSSSIRGTLKALWWNMNNLSDTLKERSIVALYRKRDDKYVFEKVMLNLDPLTVYKKYFSQTKLLPI